MGFDFWLECTDTDVLNYKRMVMDNPKLNNEFINKIFTAFAKVNNYIRIKNFTNLFRVLSAFYFLA